eukprot:jgi/Psemu1/309602/fgenesh1_kg.532_\
MYPILIHLPSRCNLTRISGSFSDEYIIIIITRIGPKSDSLTDLRARNFGLEYN